MGPALVTNAFADHFLTDAFSAGHLINKAETVEKAHGTDTDDKRMDDDATREAFEKRIARGILADSRGKALYDYESRSSAWNVVFGGGWHAMDEDSLAGVVDMIRYHDEETFYSMFVKAVHDRLNHDITEGRGGIRVKNNVGDAWKLSGDKTLKASADTLKYGKKAVDTARQADPGRRGQGKLDHAAIAKSVWDIVPVPTGTGDVQIASGRGPAARPEAAVSGRRVDRGRARERADADREADRGRRSIPRERAARRLPRPRRAWPRHAARPCRRAAAATASTPARGYIPGRPSPESPPIAGPSFCSREALRPSAAPR